MGNHTTSRAETYMYHREICLTDPEDEKRKLEKSKRRDVKRIGSIRACGIPGCLDR